MDQIARESSRGLSQAAFFHPNPGTAVHVHACVYEPLSSCKAHAERIMDSEEGDTQPKEHITYSAIVDSLFQGLAVDVTLILGYTATIKLTVGGYAKTERLVTDCSTAELVTTGLALLAVSLILLFRHAFHGFVPGHIGWRLLRCLVVETIVCSMHSHPMSCLVKTNYFYIFSVIQGGVQCMLFILALVFYIRHVPWRAVFCDTDDSLESSSVEDKGGEPVCGIQCMDCYADPCVCTELMPSSTPTRVTPHTAGHSNSRGAWTPTPSMPSEDPPMSGDTFQRSPSQSQALVQEKKSRHGTSNRNGRTGGGKHRSRRIAPESSNTSTVAFPL